MLWFFSRYKYWKNCISTFHIIVKNISTLNTSLMSPIRADNCSICTGIFLLMEAHVANLFHPSVNEERLLQKNNLVLNKKISKMQKKKCCKKSAITNCRGRHIGVVQYALQTSDQQGWRDITHTTGSSTNAFQCPIILASGLNYWKLFNWPCIITRYPTVSPTV